jgi:hypothetical protein
LPHTVVSKEIVNRSLNVIGFRNVEVMRFEEMPIFEGERSIDGEQATMCEVLPTKRWAFVKCGKRFRGKVRKLPDSIGERGEISA